MESCVHTKTVTNKSNSTNKSSATLVKDYLCK
jgi:hypothetical protein